MALTDNQLAKARAEVNDIAKVLRQQSARIDVVANILSAPITIPTPAPVVPTPTVPSLGGFVGRTTVDPKVWKQTPVFADDFSTDCAEGQFLKVYGKTFGAYPASYMDTQGQQSASGSHYNPNNISVVNGLMRIKVGFGSDGKAQAASPYPLAPSTTKIYDRTYGRYEVRVKADSIAGYKVAFLLWPQSDAWSDGEIDLVESSLNGTVNAYNHYVGDPENQDEFKSGAKLSEWHTYSCEWLPGRVNFLVDGKIYGTSTTRTPIAPMHLVLQTETNIGGIQPKQSDSGYVYVDHVSIWEPA